MIVIGGSGSPTGQDGTIYIPVIGKPIITTNNGKDYATTDPALTLERTCSPNTNAIWVNGSQNGVTYPAGQTSWSFTTTLVEGNNLFEVVAKDANLNESGLARIVITLDRTIPGAPVITTNGGGDFTTHNSHLILKGTCAADTAIILVNGSQE